MENSGNQIVSVSGDLLVQPGKSSRLLEMRNKAMQAVNPAPFQTAGIANDGNLNLSFSPELMLARQLIDQKLAEILASLPVGKQKRMFKIRFGIDLDLIRELPIKRVLSLMKIQSPALNNQLANMKRLGDLNYNGEQVY